MAARKKTRGKEDSRTQRRHQFEHLSEDELRTMVLMPLFREMGYKDVNLHHGAHELGKDIVMWTQTPIGVREYQAVVAKAGPVSGRADAGPNTANTTANQIRQCFGAMFRDPVTGGHCAVSTVIVAASGSISEPTQDAMLAALEDWMRRRVQFINGEKLAALAKEYMPNLMSLSRIAQLQEALRNASPDHRLELKICDDITTITVIPRERGNPPRADEIASFTLKPPDSPDGAAGYAALEHHHRTGAAITLTRDMIAAFDAPDVMKALWSALGEEPEFAAIQIGPIRGARFGLVLDLSSADGVEARLGPFRCEVTEGGTDQVTVKSLEPSGGWSLQLVHNARSGSTELGLSANLNGLNVRAQHNGMLAGHVLHVGGRGTLREAESGIQIGLADFMPGTLKEVPPPILLRLVKAVELIQDRTATPFKFPLDREFTGDEVKEILDIAALLETGRVERAFSSVVFRIERGAAERALAEFANGNVQALTHKRRVELDLFGSKVDLGIEVTILPNLRMSEEDAHALKVMLNSKDEFLPLRLAPASPDTKAVIWLTNSDDPSVPSPS